MGLKQFLDNFSVQMVVGLFISLIGMCLSYVLMMFSWLSYSGLDLIFYSTGGDKSPVTFAIAMMFTALTFTFPAITWLVLLRFGKLRHAAAKAKIFSFMLFAGLPLWAYICVMTYSKAVTMHSEYLSVTSACKIRDGVNFYNNTPYTGEIECSNGVFNGTIRHYQNGTFYREQLYNNGKLEREIYYNPDSSTSSYILIDGEKNDWVYTQIPEKNIYNGYGMNIDQETQSMFCQNEDDYLTYFFNYSCTQNMFDGKVMKYHYGGILSMSANYTKGKLVGTFEEFSTEGRLLRHLEFREGILYGRIYSYNHEGNIEYEGQYKDGLQEGIFRRYQYTGEVESEVVFEHGKIVKINIHS